MIRRLGLIVGFPLFLGCADAGILISPAGDLGLRGAPSGRSIVVAGGSAGRVSSENFAGFMNVGRCDATTNAVAQGAEFEMSDPLLEVVSQ